MNAQNANVKIVAALVADALHITRADREAAEVLALAAAALATGKRDAAATLAAATATDETEAEKFRLTVINLTRRAAELSRLENVGDDSRAAFFRIFANAAALAAFDSSALYTQRKVFQALAALTGEHALNRDSVTSGSIAVLARALTASADVTLSAKDAAALITVECEVQHSTGSTQAVTAYKCLALLGLAALRRDGRSVTVSVPSEKAGAVLRALCE